MLCLSCSVLKCPRLIWACLIVGSKQNNSYISTIIGGKGKSGRGGGTGTRKKRHGDNNRFIRSCIIEYGAPIYIISHELEQADNQRMQVNGTFVKNVVRVSYGAAKVSNL